MVENRDFIYRVYVLRRSGSEAIANRKSVFQNSHFEHESYMNSKMSADNEQRKIDADEFYSQYHGHPAHHLKYIHDEMRRSAESSNTSSSIIWTAGDSSLDNKYWFSTSKNAVPGVYQKLLEPPRSKCDVTYWLNELMHQRRQESSGESVTPPFFSGAGALNTAVEATTLNERFGGHNLTKQDCIIRDNIREEDILIVSIGGNDIALFPSVCTILSMVGIICCVPERMLKSGYTCYTCPYDDYCCGCGPSAISCLGGMPPCLGYLTHLFGTRVENYIRSLVSKRKPRKILVCMIYFPDEDSRSSSWANGTLGALGYNSNPSKLQQVIKLGYKEATSRINIPGVEVIPVPLFRVLDGTNSSDYVARVEPSPSGGRKMAEFFLDLIGNDQPLGQFQASTPSTPLVINRT